VSRLLSEYGHEVLVANPRKLRVIYENTTKSDRVDARMLARIARLDPNLLHPIQHRGEPRQKDLALLLARETLVRTRTSLINHVRGVAKSSGVSLPKCDADTFHKHAPGALPETLKPALMPLVETIAELCKRVASYDKEIERLCEESYPETEILQSTGGVGPVISLGFALVVEDPQRFAHNRDVGPFAGLAPRRGQSGAQDPQLGITKAGNAFLRRLLVQAAQYILGNRNQKDSELRQWGLKLAGPVDQNGKHNRRLKKRAVIAVARKLAVLLCALWRDGVLYDPFFEKHRREARKEAA